MTRVRSRHQVNALAGIALIALTATGSVNCGRRPARFPPSNDLLIVGYDREPDTMNRSRTFRRASSRD